MSTNKEEYDSIKKKLQTKESNIKSNSENETEYESDLNPRRLQSSQIFNTNTNKDISIGISIGHNTYKHLMSSIPNRKQSSHSSMTDLPYNQNRRTIKNEDIQEYYKRYSYLYEDKDASSTCTSTIKQVQSRNETKSNEESEEQRRIIPVVKTIQSNIEGIKSKLQSYKTVYDSINSKITNDDKERIKRLSSQLEEKDDERKMLISRIDELNKEIKRKDFRISELENEMMIYKSDMSEMKLIRNSISKPDQSLLDYKKKYLLEMEALKRTFEEFKYKAINDYNDLKEDRDLYILKVEELEGVIEKMKYENELNQSSIKEAESIFKGKAENIRQLIKANEILKIENDKFRNEIMYLNHQVKALSVSEKRLQQIILENEFINDKLNDFGIGVGIERQERKDRQGKVYNHNDCNDCNKDKTRSFSPMIKQNLSNLTAVSVSDVVNNEKKYGFNMNVSGNKKLGYSNSNIYKVNSKDKLLNSNLSSKVQPQFDSDTDERQENENCKSNRHEHYYKYGKVYDSRLDKESNTNVMSHFNYSHNYNNPNNYSTNCNYLLFNHPTKSDIHYESNKEVYKKTRSKDKNLIYKQQTAEYGKISIDSQNKQKSCMSKILNTNSNLIQSNSNIYSSTDNDHNSSGVIYDTGSYKNTVPKDVNHSFLNCSLKHSHSNKFPVAKQDEMRREHLAEMPLQRHATYKK